MPSSHDPETQIWRGQRVDYLVASRLKLLTYNLASEALDLAPETIRRYCDQGYLQRIYLDFLPLVTADSVRKFANTRRKGN
jgi:hypothetical protein